MNLRKNIDRVLSAGPGAGFFTAGIIFLSDEPHTAFYVLAGIACIWVGAAFIAYLSRGESQ